jgi:hypothetical protein
MNTYNVCVVYCVRIHEHVYCVSIHQHVYCVSMYKHPHPHPYTHPHTHKQDTKDKLAAVETELMTRCADAVNAQRHAASLEAQLGAIATVMRGRPPAPYLSAPCALRPRVIKMHETSSDARDTHTHPMDARATDPIK